MVKAGGRIGGDNRCENGNGTGGETDGENWW